MNRASTISKTKTKDKPKGIHTEKQHNQTPEQKRQRKALKSSEREMTHYVKKSTNSHDRISHQKPQRSKGSSIMVFSAERNELETQN